MRRRLLCVLASIVLLAGCAGARTPAAPVTQGGDVQWQDYAVSVRTRIDSLAQAKDCSGLQAEFDTADANNDATMSRLGRNNAKLMGYVDAKLKAAGCY